MRAVVINLDRSADRLAWFMDQAARLGLAMERVPAVDARDMTPGEVEALLPPPSDGKPALTTTEVACFLSHRRAWSALLDSGDDWIAVFEDDIHLAPDGIRFLRDATWIPPGIDIVKIETFFDSIKIATHGKRTRWGGRRLHRLLSMHAGTAAYLLSRRAAQRLMESTGTLRTPVDRLLFDPLHPASPDLTIRQLVPAFCIQDAILPRKQPHQVLHDSTIDHTEGLYVAAVPQKERKNRKQRSLGERIRREVTRPFRRAAGGLRALYQAIFRRQERWTYRVIDFT